jgi:hypothetical protein
VRYYGLVRDYISFSAIIKDAIEKIDVNINLYDIAKRIVA